MPSLNRLPRHVCLGIALTLATLTNAAEPRFLEQNWAVDARQTYYTTSQGSRMMPYSWFLALERPTSSERFLADKLDRFGYLPNPRSDKNPDELPVGLVKDDDVYAKKPWRSSYIGLNCSACHTNQIRFQNTTMQIDGAPTLADMSAMIDEVDKSLKATVTNAAKFKRFAVAVLGEPHSQTEFDELKADLHSFSAYWTEFAQNSRPAKAQWGRGRLDAFGMIFNRATAIDTGVAANNRKPEAPVSYPFLWGASFEDKVQWNGIAPNGNDVVRLARNAGEVLGVFAEADLKTPASPLHPYYRTSVRRVNQIRLENQLKTLWSPKWPEDILGVIDQNLAATGKILFKDRCEKCHEVVPHGDQDRSVEVWMEPLDLIGTDKTMAVNAATRRSVAGPLTGARFTIFEKGLAPELASNSLLIHAVAGAIVDLRLESLGLSSLIGAAMNESVATESIATLPDVDTIDEIAAELGITQDELAQQLQEYAGGMLETGGAESDPLSAAESLLSGTPNTRDILAYKGRPLDGIWATAPYLHNGSVLNLYELLLPPSERLEVIHVGSNEFDPVKVGFKSAPGPRTTKLDTSIEGNFGTGHDYDNASLTPDDRTALVEYMKTL